MSREQRGDECDRGGEKEKGLSGWQRKKRERKRNWVAAEMEKREGWE